MRTIPLAAAVLAFALTACQKPETAPLPERKPVLPSETLAPSPKPEFCGVSSNDPCASDADCVTGGCSGHVCGAKKEEPTFTTCQHQDCYEPRGRTCACISSRCGWSAAVEKK